MGLGLCNALKTRLQGTWVRQYGAVHYMQKRFFLFLRKFFPLKHDIKQAKPLLQQIDFHSQSATLDGYRSREKSLLLCSKKNLVSRTRKRQEYGCAVFYMIFLQCCNTLLGHAQTSLGLSPQRRGESLNLAQYFKRCIQQSL